MGMTSKQRAYLKSLASNVTPAFQIGKSSLTPEMVTAVDEALEKRELIKLSVLKNCFDEPKELAETLAERTRSQVVHVIGKKIVLYRPAKKNPKIQLPQP
ncbi:MAG: ribosome assembly RNA-binding protein YhbY [Lachnospiraceae bacterium]|nr:ribosome assembly RNA-binding protein YhbY [Lachnospiraceae bacterium]